MNIQKTMQMAVQVFNAGDFQSARNLCRKMLEHVPNEAGVLNLYGLALHQLGEHAEAARYIKKAISINPANSDFNNNLGSVYAVQRQFEKAAQSFSQAVKLKPDSIFALENLGNVNLEQGQLDKAMFQYRRVLELQPDNVPVCLKVAGVLKGQGQVNAAVDTYRRILQISPDNAEVSYLLGCVLEEQGHIKQAADCYLNILKKNSEIPDVNTGLARCLLALGHPDEAVEYCDKALQLSPDDAGAISIKAGVLHRLGELDKAYECLLPFIEEDTENVGIGLVFSDMAGDLGMREDAISVLERMLSKDRKFSDSTLSRIHFSLGRLYDAMGEYDIAFRHIKQGNALKLVDDGPYLYPNVPVMVKSFNHDRLQSLPRSDNGSDMPVFVVGMPRSGTTLVEQILSSHPKVYGAGELHIIGEQILPGLMGALGKNQQLPGCLSGIKQEALDQLARQYLDQISGLSGEGFDRVVDKMPGNFVNLWLIELLFPRAHIIHCLRDPLDTCLSAYFQDFSEGNFFTFDLGNLAKYYAIYKRLIEHWKDVLTIKIIDIEYEDLVSNTEAVCRTMMKFCELEWDDRCLQFYNERRFVGTASHDQVRKPIYRKSIGRWKSYEKQLEPLIKSLGVE